MLKSSIATLISGAILDADLNTIVNRAVREVLLVADLRSAKRKTPLSPNLFNGIYDYACPIDLKSFGIIDIRPQIKRSKSDQWRLTSTEEFDRLKSEIGFSNDNLIAIDDFDMVRKLRISRLIDDYSVVIDRLDDVGNWKGFEDGTNLTKDLGNYVKGSASLNWDISDGGLTMAGIYNDAINHIDISDYLSEGSIFVWAYIPNTDDITNFILRIGNNSSNYYYITITTNNEGTAFTAGWNLLRFDLANKVETGTVNSTDCTYCAVYMTKDVAKVNETDYRFDNIVLKRGEHYDVIYYSKYGWQSIAGAYLENSTADTDYLNYDTDEITLIEYKAAELGERYLRNQGEANNFLNLFKTNLMDYQLKNPSEALLMQTIYHFI